MYCMLPATGPQNWIDLSFATQSLTLTSNTALSMLLLRIEATPFGT